MPFKFKYSPVASLLRGVDDYMESSAAYKGEMIELARLESEMRRTKMLITQYPEVFESEETVYSLVNFQGSDAEMMGMANEVLSTMSYERSISYLEGLPDKDAIATFDSYSQTVQNAMKIGGYERPKEDKGGFQLGIGLDIGGLAGGLRSVVGAAPKASDLGGLLPGKVGDVAEAAIGGFQGAAMRGVDAALGQAERIPNAEAFTVGPADDDASGLQQVGAGFLTGVGTAVSAPLKGAQKALLGFDASEIPGVDDEFLGADRLGLLPAFDAADRTMTRATRTGLRLDEFNTAMQDNESEYGFWMWDDVLRGDLGFGEMVEKSSQGTLNFALSNPTQIVRAWNDVEVGEETFRLDAVEEVNEILNGDGEARRIAELYAAGNTPNEITRRMAEEGWKAYDVEANEETYLNAVVRVHTFLGETNEAGDWEEKPENVAAVELLGGSKLSLGRSVVRDHPFGLDFELDPNSGAGRVISGVVDGTALILLDPTLILGKVNKLRKGATRAVDMGGDIAGQLNDLQEVMVAVNKGDEVADVLGRRVRDRVANFTIDAKGRPQSFSENLAARVFVNRRQVQAQAEAHKRVFEMIRDAWSPKVADYNTGNLVRDRPQLMAAMDRMNQYVEANGVQALARQGDSGVDGVFDFLRSEDGLRTLLGSMGGIDSRYRQLPRMTRAGEARLAARRWYNDVDDWSRRVHTDEMRRELSDTYQEVTKIVDKGEFDDAMAAWSSKAMKSRERFTTQSVARSTVRPITQFIDGFVTHVPKQGNHIPLSGDEAVRDFANLLGFSNFDRLGFGRTEDVMDAFIRGGVGERRLVAQSFMYDLVNRSGAYHHMDDDAKILMDKVYGSRHQRYSLGEADQMLNGGVHTRAALFSGVQGSTSMLMAIPDLREFLSATRRGNTMRRIFHNTPVGYVEAAMSRAWKPMQLMTMSFALRASGEEALSFALRTSPLQYAMALSFSKWEADVRKGRKSTAYILDPNTGRYVKDTVQDALELASRGSMSGPARAANLAAPINTVEAPVLRQVSGLLNWMQNRRFMAVADSSAEGRLISLSANSLYQSAYHRLSHEIGGEFSDLAGELILRSDELGIASRSGLEELAFDMMKDLVPELRKEVLASSRRSRWLNAAEVFVQNLDSSRLALRYRMAKSDRYFSRQKVAWAMLETYGRDARPFAAQLNHPSPYHGSAISQRLMAGDPQMMRAFAETNSAGSIFGRAALGPGSVIGWSENRRRSVSLNPSSRVHFEAGIPSGMQRLGMRPSSNSLMEIYPFVNADGTMAEDGLNFINLSRNQNELRNTPEGVGLLEDVRDVVSESTVRQLEPLLAARFSEMFNPHTGEKMNVVQAVRYQLSQTNGYVRHKWARFAIEPTEAHLDDFVKALDDLNTERMVSGRIWLNDPPDDLFTGGEPRVPINPQYEDYISDYSFTDLFFDRVAARVAENQAAGVRVPDYDRTLEGIVGAVPRGQRRQVLDETIKAAIERAKSTRDFAAERMSAMVRMGVDEGESWDEVVALYEQAEAFAGLKRRNIVTEILNGFDEQVALKLSRTEDRWEPIYAPHGGLDDHLPFLNDDEFATVDGFGVHMREIEEKIQREGHATIGGFDLDPDERHAFAQLTDEGVFEVEEAGDILAPDFTPEYFRNTVYKPVLSEDDVFLPTGGEISRGTEGTPIREPDSDFEDLGDLESHLVPEVPMEPPDAALRQIAEDLRSQLDAPHLPRLLGATDTSRGNDLAHNQVVVNSMDEAAGVSNAITLGDLQRQMADRNFERYLANQDMWEGLDVMSHAQRVDGRPIAPRPKFGEHVEYVPMFDTVTADQFAAFWTDPNALEYMRVNLADRLSQAGYSELETRRVLHAFMWGDSTQTLENFQTVVQARKAGGHPRVPMSPYTTTDYKEAKIVGEVWDEAMAIHLEGRAVEGLSGNISPSAIGQRMSTGDRQVRRAADPFEMMDLNVLDPAEEVVIRKYTRTGTSGPDTHALWMTDEEARLRGISDNDDWVPGEEILSSGTTDMAAIRVLAEKQAMGALERLTSKDGTILNEVVSHLRHSDITPDDLMRKVPRSDLPLASFGPVLVNAESTRWERFVGGFFEGVADPVIHAVARSPIWHYNFGQALDQTAFVYRKFLANADTGIAQIISKKGLDPEHFDELFTEVWRQLDNPQFFDDPWVRVGRAIRDHDRVAFTKHLDDAVNGNLSQSTDDIFNTLISGLDGPPGPKLEAELRNRARAQAIELLEDRDLKEFIFTPEEFDELTRLGNVQAKAFGEWMAETNTLTNTLTVPFIDDHRVRSQFQQYIGSFIPFWYAEELFLKRTARALVESPEMFRRGQLMMDGLRTIGTVREDEFGNEIFLAPNLFGLGTIMADGLAIGMSLLSGQPPILAHADRLTGQTAYTIPGYKDDFGTMAFGPLVGFAVQNVTTQFPEFSQAGNRWMGADDRVVGGDQSWYEYLLPRWTTGMWNARFVSPDANRRLSADVYNSLRLAAADGRFPDGSDPMEADRFRDDTIQHARVLGMLDQFYRVMAPGGLDVGFDDIEAGKALNTDFIELLGTGIGYEEALSLWIRKHGEKATPWLMFSSESPSGAVITQNEETLRFIQDNRSVVDRYPIAAAHVLPYHDPLVEDYEFDRQARAALLRTGLREHKDLETFEHELRIQEPQRLYYAEKATYDREVFNMKTLKGQQNTRVAQDRVSEQIAARTRVWEDWKSVHKAQYPVWAKAFDEIGGSARNQTAISEMELLFTHPDTRDLDRVQAIRPLVDRFRRLELENKHLPSHNDAQRAEKEELRLRFYVWAENYARENPSARNFWEAVMRNEVTSMDQDLELVIERGRVGGGLIDAG